MEETKFIEVARTVLHCYLDVILGVVLVLAGVLKSQQLVTDPSYGRASGMPRELLIGASAFELAFGFWLIGGLSRRPTRWLALVWFTQLSSGGVGSAHRRRSIVRLSWRVAYQSLAHVRIRYSFGRLFLDMVAE